VVSAPRPDPGGPGDGLDRRQTTWVSPTRVPATIVVHADTRGCGRSGWWGALRSTFRADGRPSKLYWARRRHATVGGQGAALAARRHSTGRGGKGGTRGGPAGQLQRLMDVRRTAALRADLERGACPNVCRAWSRRSCGRCSRRPQGGDRPVNPAFEHGVAADAGTRGGGVRGHRHRASARTRRTEKDFWVWAGHLGALFNGLPAGAPRCSSRGAAHLRSPQGDGGPLSAVLGGEHRRHGLPRRPWARGSGLAEAGGDEGPHPGGSAALKRRSAVLALPRLHPGAAWGGEEALRSRSRPPPSRTGLSLEGFAVRPL